MHPWCAALDGVIRASGIVHLWLQVLDQVWPQPRQGKEGGGKSILLFCGINNNVYNHLSSLVKIPSLCSVVVNFKAIGIVL